MIALAVGILCCASSQLLLKFGMAGITSLPSLDSLPAYAIELIQLPIVAGLALYAIGTGLWLVCLTKLDLSVAYPASAVQFLLIFAGAWHFFGEPVSGIRLLGAAVVLLGVLLLTLDRNPSPVSSEVAPTV
jgi:drug/metabolite transporter (DMT)-like permease